MQQKIIGIMGAMPEETGAVVSLLQDRKEFVKGMRTYHTGNINGIKTVLVFSRWGKVAAAATVSTLIHHFNITELIFTGVAGAVNNALHVGDIVIAKRLVQHDMDARPLMPQFEIPLLKKTYFETGQAQLLVATKAVETLLQSNHLHQLIAADTLKEFDIVDPVLQVGDIASGDQFFSSSHQRDELIKKLPAACCVEMEGAAVAQVCYENGIPFTIIRTISDAADQHSPLDFPAFISKVAGKYSSAIISNIYQQQIAL